jgi:AcrR family transcriptional regulator
MRGKRLPADDRRAHILDAARKVFAAQGYASSNVAAICEHAGIARGTFYLYFDNKADILVALLEGVEERIKDIMEKRPSLEAALLRYTRNKPDTVVRFCEERLRQLLEAVCLDEQTLRVVLREARGAGGIIEKTIERIDDIVLGALERDITIAQEARMLRQGNARLAARYILGGIEKVLLLALGNDEPIVLPEVIRETVHLELFGLLSDEARPCR